jgi:hypothetical protein
MNKAAARARLREALEQVGAGWVFEFWGADTDKNLDQINKGLDEFITEYERRFGEKPDPFQLAKTNPYKGAAFFQVDTLLVSVEMKVMVWRVLLGCEIAKVAFDYKAGSAPAFSVTLSRPYGDGTETYEGRQPADFRVLRHFGITGVGEQVYLQGYYAARGA